MHKCWACQTLPLEGSCSSSLPFSRILFGWFLYILVALLNRGFFFFSPCPRVDESARGQSIPYAVGSIRGGVSFVSMSSSLLPFSKWLIFCFVEVVRPALSSSSGGIILYIGIELVCSWRR